MTLRQTATDAWCARSERQHAVWSRDVLPGHHTQAMYSTVILLQGCPRRWRQSSFRTVYIGLIILLLLLWLLILNLLEKRTDSTQHSAIDVCSMKKQPAMHVCVCAHVHVHVCVFKARPVLIVVLCCPLLRAAFLIHDLVLWRAKNFTTHGFRAIIIHGVRYLDFIPWYFFLHNNIKNIQFDSIFIKFTNPCFLHQAL